MRNLFLPLAISLAVPLAASAQSTTPNPFGIGADNQTSQAWNKWLPQMSSIGLTEVRGLRCGWGDVEPEEGKWAWDRLDNQLRDAGAQHVNFTGLFVYLTKWDTKDKPGGLPINALPEWSEYVTQTVKHIGGRVKYYEVWNEPPNFTNNAPASDYAKVVAATYNAAKAADPNCLVGLAAQSNNVNYLYQAIRAGAKDHFDYVTLHPYEILGSAGNGSEAVYMSIVPTMRKMLAAEDPAKVNVPIWFTELGTEINDHISPDDQAHALVKAYTMGIGQGVSCIQWFECMDGDSGKMGLLDRDGKPRPAYTAMAQLVKQLGQHPDYLGWILLNNQDYGFVFKGSTSNVLATWAPPGVTDNVNLGQPVQIIDPISGAETTAATCALTNAPVLISGAPQNLVAQAQANKNRPFPWGGDYTNAKSVSITMGARNVEKGLHTMSGATLAADVSAYGGSARSGAIPGGNVFVIDPNFLSFTTVPIEITVVVRRNPAND
ncbi:MAG TPA: hypothetical protein VG733_16415, partial [Chthoniobacteraceae bacterium]|nr:hypothetical protein [Chthoniobacteraceae bacterium]